MRDAEFESWKPYMENASILREIVAEYARQLIAANEEIDALRQLVVSRERLIDGPPNAK